MAGNPLYGIMCKFVPRRLLVSGFLLWHSSARFDSIRLFRCFSRCQMPMTERHPCFAEYSVISSYLGCFLYGPATVSHGFIRRRRSSALLSQTHFDFSEPFFSNAHTGIIVLAVAWPVAGLLAGVWIALQVIIFIDTTLTVDVLFCFHFAPMYPISNYFFCSRVCAFRNFDQCTQPFEACFSCAKDW